MYVAASSATVGSNAATSQPTSCEAATFRPHTHTYRHQDVHTTHTHIQTHTPGRTYIRVHTDHGADPPDTGQLIRSCRSLRVTVDAGRQLLCSALGMQWTSAGCRCSSSSTTSRVDSTPSHVSPVLSSPACSLAGEGYSGSMAERQQQLEQRIECGCFICLGRATGAAWRGLVYVWMYAATLDAQRPADRHTSPHSHCI